jgi:hypothetical protein
MRGLGSNLPSVVWRYWRVGVWWLLRHRQPFCEEKICRSRSKGAFPSSMERQGDDLTPLQLI